jgi:hypothetical protein
MINSVDGPRTNPVIWLVDRPSIFALLLNLFLALCDDDLGKATFSLSIRRQIRAIIRTLSKCSGSFAFPYYM